MATHVVLCICDDLPVVGDQLIGQMAWVNANMKLAGLKFSRNRATMPRCGPNRASLLTGLYPRDHTVIDNDWSGAGGAFDQSSTIATALKTAGYRTALYGKYSNEWAGNNCTRADCTAVPPGWDIFHAHKSNGEYIGEPTYELRVANLGHNGTTASETRHNNDTWTTGTDNDPNTDYSPDLLAYRAEQTILTTPASTPLFVYYAPKGVHEPLTPAARYASSACPAGTWNPLSWNEGCTGAFDTDISDKPEWVRSLLCLPASTQESLLSRCRVLKAIDDGLARLWNACVTSGRTTGGHDTLFLFTSDNGFLMGEHRIAQGKNAVYIGSRDIPLFAYWPGRMGGAPRTIPHLTVTADIPVTLADIAGTTLGHATPNTVSFKNEMVAAAAPYRDTLLMYSLLEVDETRQWIAVETDEGELYNKNHFEDLVGDELRNTEFYKPDDPAELVNKHRAPQDPADTLRIAELDPIWDVLQDNLDLRIHPEGLIGKFESNTATQTVVIPVGIDCPAGYHYVVRGQAGNALGVQATLADSAGGNAYQTDIEANDLGPALFMLSARLDQPLTGGASTITISLSLNATGGTPDEHRWYAYLERDMKQTGWFHTASALGSGTSTSVATPPLRTSVEGELLVVHCSYHKDGGVFKGGSGFIPDPEVYAGTGRKAVGMHQVVFAPNEFTATATIDLPQPWRIIMGAYLQEPPAEEGGGEPPPQPPPFPSPPDPAPLTRARDAIREALSDALEMTFVPGLLEGPIENCDLGSVYASAGGERQQDVNTGEVTFVIRIYKRYWQQIEPDHPFDPEPLERYVQDVDAALQPLQTTIDPGLWFIRVTGFEIDIPTQGVEITIAAWLDNPAV